MIAALRRRIGRWMCGRGRHSWSRPVPLDEPARKSVRPGKAKWSRICLRSRADGKLCGAKTPGYMRRVG